MLMSFKKALPVKFVSVGLRSAFWQIAFIFSLSYSTLWRVYSGNSGNILSPGFPDFYPHNSTVRGWLRTSHGKGEACFWSWFFSSDRSRQCFKWNIKTIMFPWTCIVNSIRWKKYGLITGWLSFGRLVTSSNVFCNCRSDLNKRNLHHFTLQKWFSSISSSMVWITLSWNHTKCGWGQDYIQIMMVHHT